MLCLCSLECCRVQLLAPFIMTSRNPKNMLYTDDLLLYELITFMQDFEAFQEETDAIEQWSTEQPSHSQLQER